MKELRQLKINSIASVLLWSALLGGFGYYDFKLAQQHMQELALKEARASFNTNQAFRLWVVRHGGVYVPTDDNTPPNPALAHIPERDIVTPSGKKLTLMNSAYVLRQLMEDFGELHGIKGKLTSFKLLNPKNVPDNWEAEALHRFETGAEELAEFTDIDGEPYLRLMGVMLVQEGCLKCHGVQGDYVGEVRGGASISIPMRPYLQTFHDDIRKKRLIYFAIWLIGLIGIISWSLLTRRRILEKNLITLQMQRQHQAIERANAELTHFANISAHHLMEPARRLLSFTQRLRTRIGDNIQDDEDARLSLEYIEKGAARMRDLLRDIERFLAANIARGPLQLNDTHKALNEAHRRLSRLIAEQNAHIDANSLLPVYLDLPRLTDLFEVLLANALIHARTDAPTKIRISTQAQPSAVRVRVEDNGPGIADEYRARVFGVFDKLKQNPLAGTGIGLAIARSIVESRNGKIWIETATLGGTAVVFDLPTGTEKI